MPQLAVASGTLGSAAVGCFAAWPLRTAAALLSPTSKGSLLSRHPGGKQLEAKELVSLESLLLAGQKKAPKIYTLAVHPLQPHIVAVGANAGKTCQTLCDSTDVIHFCSSHHVILTAAMAGPRYQKPLFLPDHNPAALMYPCGGDASGGKVEVDCLCRCGADVI